MGPDLGARVPGDAAAPALPPPRGRRGGEEGSRKGPVDSRGAGTKEVGVEEEEEIRVSSEGEVELVVVVVMVIVGGGGEGEGVVVK